MLLLKNQKRNKKESQIWDSIICYYVFIVTYIEFFYLTVAICMPIPQPLLAVPQLTTYMLTHASSARL